MTAGVREFVRRTDDADRWDFRRISRRHARLVTSTSAASTLYARKVHIRSVVPPGSAPYGDRSLVVGIAEPMREERNALSRGRPCAGAPSGNPGRRHG